MQFPDFKHFATTGLPVTERSFDTGFSLLDNYAYSTNTRWVQANISWYTPYLLLKFLPFLKRRIWMKHCISVRLQDMTGVPIRKSVTPSDS